MSQRQRFSIQDVSGGMNDDQHPLYIAENEAADLLNFRIDRIGGLTGREGQIQVGQPVDSDTRILALGRWSGEDRLDTSVLLVALSDGTLRVVDEDSTDGIGPVIYSGLDTSAQGMFLSAENLVLYANGVDGIVAFNGEEAFPVYIEPPSEIDAFNLGQGGLTGTHKFGATYVSTELGWESPMISSPELPSNGDTVEIAVPASPHPMVDRVYFYRTLDEGNTFLFLGSISNDFDEPTFYDDGTVQPSPAQTPPQDVIVPGEDVGKRAENIAYHKGRLWASVGDELYWSRPYQWNYFPYFTNTKVPFEGNDTITALKAFQDYLIVFGEMNTVLVAGGNSDFDIQLVRQDTDIGAPSRHAMVEVDNQLVFLSARGLHVFPGFAEYAPRLTRMICEATTGCRKDASMVYVPEERSLWLSITDKTWTVHLVNQGVTRYDFYMRKPLSGGKTGTGKPVWVNAEHARVNPVNATHLNQYGGTTDFGEPISYYYKSRIWTLDSPDLLKYWRRVGLFAHSGGEMTATISCPDTLRSYSVSLDPTPVGETSFWAAGPGDVGAALWDSSVWSVEGLLYYLSALPAHTLYGRSLQVELRAVSDAGIDIHSPITLQFRAGDRFLGR